MSIRAEPIQEEELVARACAGRHAVFSALASRHRNELYRISLQKLRRAPPRLKGEDQ